MNSTDFCLIAAPLVCRLAAHGAGDRNDVRKHLHSP